MLPAGMRQAFDVAGRRTCGGSARCLQIGRKKATSRRGLGRTSLMSGAVDSGREIGPGKFDANDPKATLGSRLASRTCCSRDVGVATEIHYVRP
jgi:hypothetical protein